MDPFGHDPGGHICSTYNIHDPRPGDCPACVDVAVVWAHGEEPQARVYCHEHRDWHEGRDIHSECEACERERNETRTLSDEELQEFASGAVCDGHLWEEEDEEEE